MPLLNLGISHHTAPIEIRERVALREGDGVARLQAMVEVPGIDEGLLLATCNRTEFYCSGPAPRPGDVLDWVHRAWNLQEERLDRYFYTNENADAVRHLVRVAGGMDSLVLGESQILGQLKQAWQEARAAQTAGVVIDRLCQHAVTTAKSIRHRVGIGDKPVSVAYTAIVLARQLFSDLGSRRVLLIGAGEMIELCARHLCDHGVTRLAIANRDVARAERLAATLGADPVALADLDAVLPEADILITSTASESAVVTVDAVRKALRKRRYRPMFIVDIAVPRDVDPAVDALDDVYLYTIDDLQQVVDENVDKRSEAAREAAPIVETAVEDFLRWLNGARAADALQQMRETAHEHSRDLVERALRRLEAGHDPKAVLEQMGSTLANRILHAPSKHLRRAAEEDDLELLAAINRIYAPEEDQADVDDPPSQAGIGEEEDAQDRPGNRRGRAGGAR
ncbi:MAG: glutamyl-tRNA reductase [Xanthomonadales bacterium]|nr:glutamyl-tRNA reductase [Xanthomonadales bacterium]